MTTRTDLSTIRAEFRATLTALDNALTRAADQRFAVIDAHAYVVVDAIGPMTFDLAEVAKGKAFATATGHSAAHCANRFTRTDADRLARATNARPMHWKDAARAQAEKLRQSLTILDDLPAGSVEGEIA